jgi:hypothetical protein
MRNLAFVGCRLTGVPVSYLLIMLAAVLSLPAQAQDQAILDSPAGQQNGLIVWGKYGLNDCSRPFSNQPATVDIGDVKASDLLFCKTSEVVAFTAGKAPAYSQAAFTSAADTVNLNYQPMVDLRVKVWVLCADANCSVSPITDDTRTDIVTKLAAAKLLFLDQGAGIQLNLNDPNLISDQTANAAKNKYHDFGSQCDKFLDLVSGILDKDALNLYIVRSVENQFGRGQTCWLPNVAALGYLFDGGLIAHEMGHDHWLQHAELFQELAALGTKNIMHSLSTERTYLSEGEVFRMHFERNSVLNRVNAKYSNPPVRRPEARSCNDGSAIKPSKPCPSLGLRLWTDTP